MKKIFLSILTAVFFLTLFSCEKADDPSSDYPGEEEENEENNLPLGYVDIISLGYKLVYDPYALGVEEIAEKFRDNFFDNTDVMLDLVEYKSSKKETHRIFFGNISSNNDSSKEKDSLTKLTASLSSAYSIRFVDETLLITATSNSALRLAAEELLSMIKDNRLMIHKDFEKTVLIYSDESGDITIDETDLSSSSMLAELRINNSRLDEFSAVKDTYRVFYASTENYPTVSAKALNRGASVNVVQASQNDGKAKITVISEDGKNESVYTVNFEIKESAEVVSEIVNKDAKEGVITFVFDDGDRRSADIIISKLMKKYDSVRPSFGIITSYLAEAKRAEGGFILTPVKSSYSPIGGSVFPVYNTNYEFWRHAASIDGVDIISHSHTHTSEGISSDPRFELEASQAILRELCGSSALTYVLPGVGTIDNIDKYYEALDSGMVYIGARATGSSVNSYNTYNRFRVRSYAINRYGTLKLDSGAATTNESSTKEACLEAGISEWTNYIDTAINDNAWACFCIHSVIPSSSDSKAKWFIYEQQADALLAYADKLSVEGKAWVANFTEASIYYAEWSSAKIGTVVNKDESVVVTLTDKEDDEIFNMPLTVKVPVPLSWTTASYEYSKSSGELSIHTDSDGTKFVYVNIIPDTEPLIIKP